MERPPKRVRAKLLLQDAWQLIWRARRRLALGVPLMFINRLAGLVLPYTTKYLIDDVIAHANHELLWWLVGAGAIAAVISSTTEFGLAQILGIAAQRTITDLRLKLQQHVQRLPIGYFDTTKTGV